MRAPKATQAIPTREWLLAVGFVLLVAAAVVSVALPELSKDPDGEPARVADAGR